MKLTLIITFLLLSTVKFFAQADSTISFVAYWVKGDSKNFKITKRQTQIRNGVETINRSTEYTVNCSVIDSTETSYVLEWNYDNLIIKQINIPVELSDDIEKYKYMKVVYQTNELGIVQDILNWKEIQDLSNELFDKISDFYSTKSIDYSKALKPLRDIVGSKEGISNLVLKEIHAFHFPMGILLSLADTIGYEENLPNMLGGDPIKGNGKLYLQYLDEESFKCTLINILELDSLDSKKMVKELMNTMLAKAQFKTKEEKENAIIEMNKEFSKMSLQINDYNVYDYLYYPGWPISVHTKRTAKVNTKEVEVMTIEEIIIEKI